MSDMVQQPVIQLVQELTMTAVVEQHDCTVTKKEGKKNQEVPGPVWIPTMHLSLASLPALYIPLKWYTWTEECPDSRLLLVLSPELDSSNTKELRICHFYLHPSILGDWLTISVLDEGRRECFQTGPTQLVTLPFIRLSSLTSEIYWHKKVIIYIYKEPEVLQTNTCLSIKTYVIFLNRHYNALSADIQNCWAV